MRSSALLPPRVPAWNNNSVGLWCHLHLLQHLFSSFPLTIPTAISNNTVGLSRPCDGFSSSFSIAYLDELVWITLKKTYFRVTASLVPLHRGRVHCDWFVLSVRDSYYKHKADKYEGTEEEGGHPWILTLAAQTEMLKGARLRATSNISAFQIQNDPVENEVTSLLVITIKNYVRDADFTTQPSSQSLLH